MTHAEHRGRLVGYARTSTTEQEAGLEAQVRDLKTAGCTKIFQEQVSSIGQRGQLEPALDYVRAGDTLVVTKVTGWPARRSGFGISSNDLRHRGRRCGASTAEPRGRNGRHEQCHGQTHPHHLRRLCAIRARDDLQRQREGIAKAKAEKRYMGRRPTARLKLTRCSDFMQRAIPPPKLRLRWG